MSKNESDSATLSKDQIKAITETAAAVAVREYQKEAERDHQDRKDKRLYNTKLLMEKYRGMVTYCSDAIYDANHLDEDMELQEILELMDSKSGDVSLTVESIQARVVKTRIILDHVDKMLNFYRSQCIDSGKKEDERKWLIVDHLYISDDKKTVEELANKFYVDERTIYRYIKTAMQDLSALFFGYLE